MSDTHKHLVLTAPDQAAITTILVGSSHNELADVVANAKPFCPSTEEQRSKAMHRHVDEECEIDADAGISEADDGYWVQAWVWVPKPAGEIPEELL